MTFIDSISSWVPPWLIGVITMIVPVIVALVIYRWFIRRLIRLAGRYSPFLQKLLARRRGPESPILIGVVAGAARAAPNFPCDVTAPNGRARVEGEVVVEGETGWIETITSTYVVVRLWDLRRMVVPLSYFIEKPFQNWTYEGAAQIGEVLLRVGYTVSVDRLRQKLEEIVRQSPLWDGKGARLEATDVAIDAVELRALVSARNPGPTLDLRCEVREKLLAFLQAPATTRHHQP